MAVPGGPAADVDSAAAQRLDLGDLAVAVVLALPAVVVDLSQPRVLALPAVLVPLQVVVDLARLAVLALLAVPALPEVVVPLEAEEDSEALLDLLSLRSFSAAMARTTT